MVNLDRLHSIKRMSLMNWSNQKKENEGYKQMWRQYTYKALFVYYLDLLMDVLNGIILEYPQDIAHFALFFTMIPFRFVGLSLLSCYNCSSLRWRNLLFSDIRVEDADKDDGESGKSCLYRFVVRLSRCGVLIRKLDPDDRIFEFSKSNFLFVHFHLQRYDSLNIYMNVLTIGAFVYFWKLFITSYQSKDFEESVLNQIFCSIYNTFGYELDISDITFICLWAVLRIILNIVEMVYFCVELASQEEQYCKKVKKLLGLILACQRRKPLSMLFEGTNSSRNVDFNKVKEDRAKRLFNLRMANFELLFVKIFCTEETYLRFRRRNRNWKQMVSNNMSLHKDMVCLVLAITFTFVVNFFEEHQYSLQYISQDECVAKGGYCIADINTNCWCTLDLFKHIPTFVLVVGAGVLAVTSAIRAVVTTIFNIWLQPKLVHTTWAMTTIGSVRGWGEALVFPQTADITEAWYGYPKVPDWREEVEKMRGEHNDLTIEQISELFKEEDLIDVTKDIKYYLFQGGTSFSLVAETDERGDEKEVQPIMIVKGEWRGGASVQGNKSGDRVREMMQSEAIQAIYISRVYDQGAKVKWEQKAPYYLEIESERRIKQIKENEQKSEFVKAGEVEMMDLAGSEKKEVSAEITIELKNVW